MEGDASAGSNSGKNTATPSRPLGLSNLSDLASVVTASGSDNMLVGRGTHSGISVWGTSPTMSREVSPNSSSQSASSKAAVNKAWADSVPQSLHQSIVGEPSSPTGVSSSPKSSSAVSSGVVDSSNPYAGAFASSLQQPFVRVTDGKLESTSSVSRQSSSNWSSSAGEGDNVSDGGSAETSWAQSSAGGTSPGATSLFRVGVLRLLALAMLMLPLARGKSPT